MFCVLCFVFYTLLIYCRYHECDYRVHGCGECVLQKGKGGGGGGRGCVERVMFDVDVFWSCVRVCVWVCVCVCVWLREG